MKERPIIFTENIDKIIDGTKTMTRRVVNPKTLEKFVNLTWNPQENICFCPYGRAKDMLWVRETWAESIHSDGYNEDGSENVHGCPAYKSGMKYRCGKKVNKGISWNSPIFMPRNLSRILLEVVSVRVERVQDISEKDAIKEGIDERNVIVGVNCYGGLPIEEFGYRYFNDVCDGEGCHTAKEAFGELWDSINAKRGYPWGANPWVWVIEFKVIEVKK